jgi:phosphoribosyl 1,2-cyclic phosphodiesterase
MKLHVIGTGSKGNCYILETENNERLIIELGVRFKEIKKAIDFDLKSVSGCLCTHVHKDHSISVKDAIEAGLNVYSIIDEANCKIENKQSYKIGSFSVMPLEAKHDVPCSAFLINHPESGLILFATDTIYLKFKIENLSQIIIEANYCENILDEYELYGRSNEYVSSRVRRSHMSVQQCEKTIMQNDISGVQNIVLIHLSDSNSHEIRFKKQIEDATSKNVTVASNGISIDFNKTPF